jgi:hypothetical protein
LITLAALAPKFAVQTVDQGRDGFEVFVGHQKGASPRDVRELSETLAQNSMFRGLVRCDTTHRPKDLRFEDKRPRTSAR